MATNDNMRSGRTSLDCTEHADRLDKLLVLNRQWAADRVHEDPDYFNRLLAQQAPEYFWIGCADSRVPANVIMGLAPGEVFTQRNVGNQATHSDMNAMSCLEYAVTELKVKSIITCGHYGCGAVKAALRLPSKTQGLVNCWISDIRECRNQHFKELKALGSTEEQVNKLCELNVIRQTFHVCTSPIVQAAWDQGQDLSVFGVIYSLKDGLVRRLVGPLTKDNACLDLLEYQERWNESSGKVLEARAPSVLPYLVPQPPVHETKEESMLQRLVQADDPSSMSEEDVLEREELHQSNSEIANEATMHLANKIANHTRWSEAPRA